MSIGPVGTYCYRLLIKPELGEGLGNTVYVGLDVVDPDTRAPLIFSGLPRQVKVVRDELGFARKPDGHSFSTTYPTNARELRVAMRFRGIELFDPKLVLGEEILALW